MTEISEKDPAFPLNAAFAVDLGARDELTRMAEGMPLVEVEFLDVPKYASGHEVGKVLISQRLVVSTPKISFVEAPIALRLSGREYYKGLIDNPRVTHDQTIGGWAVHAVRQIAASDSFNGVMTLYAPTDDGIDYAGQLQAGIAKLALDYQL